MNSIDIIIGILLIIGLFRGLWKGLIIELASLLAIVLGIYGAIHFSFYVGDYLKANFEWNQDTTEATAFIITLLGIMIIIMLLGKILTKIFSLAALGFMNRFFGGIFGVLKVAVIIGAILLFLSRTDQTSEWIPQKAIKTSLLYEPIKSIGELVYANVMDNSSNSKITIPRKKVIPLPNIRPFDKDTMLEIKEDSIPLSKELKKDTIPIQKKADTINWNEII